MFAYCGNNPVKYNDPNGYYYYVAGVDDDGSMLNSLQHYVGAGTAAVGLVIATMSLAKNSSNHKKPVNLPARKKIKIDIDHITSGHMPGGNRNPNGNKDIFWGMTVNQVMKAIYEAYETASKLQTQGDRIRLTGISDTFGLVIEMWINIVTCYIETAYPK